MIEIRPIFLGLLVFGMSQRLCSIPSYNFLRRGEDFKETLQAQQGITVVLFSGIGCPPCKRMKAMLKKLLAEQRMPEQITILEVPVDQFEKLADAYTIETVPTLIFFVKGKQKKVLVGSMGERAFLAALDQVIALKK
jgi:thioredoxin 1